jgi:hypothetical protein
VLKVAGPRAEKFAMALLSPSRPAATTPADADAVASFLRCQSAHLRWALRAADACHDVAPLLARHDAAHATWITTISAVARSGDERSAELLASLYALAGRVAGCLERGFDPRLDQRVAHQVRVVLAAHLVALTETCVAAVRNGPQRG